MATCRRCGRGGWFFKVGKAGLCVDCVRIEMLREEENQLKSNLERLKGKCLQTEKSYEEIQERKEELRDKIAEQAKADALSQINAQITSKNNELEALENSIKEHRDTFKEVLEELDKSRKSVSLNANKPLKIQSLFKSVQYSVQKYFENWAPDYEVDGAVINDADELLSATVQLKLNLLDVRELRKRYALNNKVIKELTAKYERRYTTKTNATIYKLMVIALEAELQNILYNMKFAKLEKSVKAVKAMTGKYQKIVSDGNQSIAPTVTAFIGEIEYLFIEAVKIEYEYYIQQERIKEEQRAIREQMRQEAAERKRLEEERKKIDFEEQKYRNEIESSQAKLRESTDAAQIKQLQDHIAKLQEQMSKVEEKKERIVNLQSGLAGYVYVISNLGSFGDAVFKVGMTRRMEPQERIDELGNASVPFNFDVHCMIFSNDAPKLETALHKNLHNNRVNKINLRKEFFRTTVDELEELVYSIDPTASFNKTMLAEQYYQSMAVDEVPENVEIINIAEEDEEDVL
jgi:predicted  nucleic acid-binding Zn-ribbon protein